MLTKFYGQIEAPADRAPRAWPTYMTARVAADYSDTSQWTIRRNVQPCGRRGRTLVYSIDAVEQWMRGASLVAPRDPAPVQRPKRRPSASTKRGKDLAARHSGGAAVEDRKSRVTP